MKSKNKNEIEFSLNKFMWTAKPWDNFKREIEQFIENNNIVNPQIRLDYKMGYYDDVEELIILLSSGGN